LEVSWNQHKKRDSTYLELYGDRGGAQLEPSLELYGAKGEYLVDITPAIDFDVDSTNRRFRQQALHFVDCINGDTTCLSPAEDGVEVMKIVDAIYQSAEEGHEVRLAD